MCGALVGEEVGQVGMGHFPMDPSTVWSYLTATTEEADITPLNLLQKLAVR